MKATIAAILFFFVFSSCKKDKFTTEPQISFKSFSSNVAFSNNLDPRIGPVLNIKLTDAEGDFGFGTGDTSYVYVKNITIPPFRIDSFRFPPDLSTVNRKNLNVDVGVLINRVLVTSGQSNRPYTDTLFFEVFVRDFAGNKSNVITTPEPLYYITP